MKRAQFDLYTKLDRELEGLKKEEVAIEKTITALEMRLTTAGVSLSVFEMCESVKSIGDKKIYGQNLTENSRIIRLTDERVMNLINLYKNIKSDVQSYIKEIEKRMKEI